MFIFFMIIITIFAIFMVRREEYKYLSGYIKFELSVGIMVDGNIDVIYKNNPEWLNIQYVLDNSINFDI